MAVNLFLGRYLTIVFYNKNTCISSYASILIGMTSYYAILLLGVPISVVAYGSITAGIALALLQYGSERRQIFRKIEVTHFIFLVIIFAPFLYMVVSEPLRSWDARSIWFFHAKMIFYGGGINDGTGFQEETVLFSHVDYPNLIPGIAAWAATYAGFWNEYVPKMGLLVLWWIILIALSETKELELFWKIAFIFLFLLYRNELVYNGSMDLWIGIFAFLSHLYFILFIRDGKGVNLANSLYSCLILCQIKNEGFLLAIIILFNFAVILFINKHKVNMRHVFTVYLRPMLLLIFSLPIFLWAILKHRWNLENDLHLFSINSLENAAKRFNLDMLSLIYEKLVKNQGIQELLVMIFALIVISALYVYIKRIEKSVVFQFLIEFITPINTALVYLAGLFVVYLATPLDLSYHLKSSAHRVVAPVFLLFCLTVYPAFSLKTLNSRRGKNYFGY